MELLLLKAFFLFSIVGSFAQKADTIVVDAKNLQIKNLHFGNSNYMIYSRKGADKPNQNNTLVKINVSKQDHNGQEAVVINQIWYESDTVSHTSFTLLKANDLSTIQHNYWWKRNRQNISLNFEKKTANIEGKISDVQKEKFLKSFNQAAESGYFLNWHSDLVMFPLLPFKENTVFKIKFYYPGFSLPSTEIYKVVGSETLKGLAGENIDCWVLEYALPKGMTGYQRFWIAKKTREFIKEEDKIGEYYRIKLRMVVSEKD
jgi:hypothetical protein